MKRAALFLIASIGLVKINAQVDSTRTEESMERKLAPNIDDTQINTVERWPEFPGGQQELHKFVTLSLKYPESAKKARIEGVISVSFTVEKDGSVNKVEILKGLHEEMDSEAIRVVESMPRWSPGVVKGVPCAVQYNLPIRFRLP